MKFVNISDLERDQMLENHTRFSRIVSGISNGIMKDGDIWQIIRSY